MRGWCGGFIRGPAKTRFRALHQTRGRRQGFIRALPKMPRPRRPPHQPPSPWRLRPRERALTQGPRGRRRAVQACLRPRSHRLVKIPFCGCPAYTSPLQLATCQLHDMSCLQRVQFTDSRHVHLTMCRLSDMHNFGKYHVTCPRIETYAQLV